MVLSLTSLDVYQLYIPQADLWEKRVFPRIKNRFRNEADRRKGFLQITNSIKEGK